MARDRAGVVIAAAPRDPATYPVDEKTIGWHGAQSVADEIMSADDQALAMECDATSIGSIAALFETAAA